MAALSLSVHSATTLGLISFIYNIKELSGFLTCDLSLFDFDVFPLKLSGVPGEDSEWLALLVEFGGLRTPPPPLPVLVPVELPLLIRLRDGF